MKIKYEDYRIGFLTKLFGVTPDTIRLYEKKGILSSRKDRESNYRLFQRDDVFNLDYARRLREMQFSLDEIREILREDRLCDTVERAGRKLAELDFEIEKLYEIRETLLEYQKTLQEASSGEMSLQITEPVAILMMDIEDGLWENIEYFRSLSRDSAPAITVIENAPISIMSEQSLLEDAVRESAEVLLTALEPMGKEINSDFLKDKIKRIPPQRYMTALVKTKKGKNYQDIPRMGEKIKACGYRVTGKAMARYKISMEIGKTPIDYYELWVPVEIDSV